MPFWGKAATARKPSKIKGYSDFMILPKNKKFSPNLVFGDFFMFLGTFLGNRRGRCLPSPAGRNGENKYSFTEIGKLVFYSNLFPDFFNSIKIDFLKILISKYFVFFSSSILYIFSNCTSV